jgi:hypothetical protein
VVGIALSTSSLYNTWHTITTIQWYESCTELAWYVTRTDSYS